MMMMMTTTMMMMMMITIIDISLVYLENVFIVFFSFSTADVFFSFSQKMKKNEDRFLIVFEIPADPIVFFSFFRFFFVF